MSRIDLRGNRIRVEMGEEEAKFLRNLPKQLDEVGTDPADPAGPRLNQSAYPDDPVASAEYEIATSEALTEARRVDRSTFTATLPTDGTVDLDVEQAESWMRVLGDARLTLATRLGIDDSSWEHMSSAAPPGLQLLHYLTALQESLILALDRLIDRP